MRFGAALLCGLVVGCGGGDDDTYLDFFAEGQDYHIEHVTLDMMPIEGGRYFFNLAQDPLEVNIVRAVPSAAFVWRMPLGSPSELAGREFDLAAVDDPSMAIIFTLTEDVTLHPDDESELRIEFTGVGEEYVEGTFTGTDLLWVSMVEDMTRRMPVSGSFRARRVER